MSTRLFGTDGIRGTANREPMTAETALKVGTAAGLYFRRGDHKHRVLIGKDTRLSGYMLEPALTAGFISMGMDVILVGPIPTPAVAMLTRSMRCDLGVMLTASHNPFDDNGIKFFSGSGQKLPDDVQHRIERMLDAKLWDNPCWLAFRLNYLALRYNTPLYDWVQRSHGLSRVEYVVIYSLALTDGGQARDISEAVFNQDLDGDGDDEDLPTPFGTNDFHLFFGQALTHDMVETQVNVDAVSIPAETGIGWAGGTVNPNRRSRSVPWTRSAQTARPRSVRAGRPPPSAIAGAISRPSGPSRSARRRLQLLRRTSCRSFPLPPRSRRRTAPWSFA